MNMSKSLLCLWLSAVGTLFAQDYVKPPELATNPNATVITSDVFRLDMVKKEGIFTTNVQVVAQDFRMKADEITVFFAAGTDGKIDHLLATGNVVIEQPDRTAKANQAEYGVAEDKMVLTGSPDILQKGGNHITGTTITIYRSTNRMEVDGRSRMVLFSDLSSPSQATPAAK
jgi:lipopolysaccharide export system protein LptA